MTMASTLSVALHASAAGGPQHVNPARGSVEVESIPIDVETTEDEFLERHLLELEAERRELGEFHPSVAETLNLLGLHHHHVTDDQDEALRLHSEALEVLRRCVAAGPAAASGPASVAKEVRAARLVEAATTLTDIGNVNKAMGDADEALRAYDESLDVFRSLEMKDDHPRVAATIRCVHRIDKFWAGAPAGCSIYCRGEYNGVGESGGNADVSKNNEERVSGESSSSAASSSKDLDGKNDGNVVTAKRRCGSSTFRTLLGVSSSAPAERERNVSANAEANSVPKFNSYLPTPSSRWGGRNN